ncbi:MAG: C10 family peptidase [Bacteroidales bacterium]
MKKIVVFIFTVLYFSISSRAQDFSQAEIVAQEFFSKHTDTVSLDLVYRTKTNTSSVIYAFNNRHQGYVIVIYSKNEYSIGGYSRESKIPTDKQNGVYNLLQIYEQLEFSKKEKPSTLLKSGATNSNVAPLLDEAGIRLTQYNHDIAGGCPTGCVATAMTQIMAYHKHPSHGVGSHCYTHNSYGELCADFETEINWTAPNYKNLSEKVGIAMDMDYCGSPYGSVPTSPNSAHVLQDYYNYHTFIGPTDADYIKNELQNGRPVYVSIPGDPIGHAIVVDGYDSLGYFHINFGWGGTNNGYYMLNKSQVLTTNQITFGLNVDQAVYISPTPYITNEQDSLALIQIYTELQQTWDTTKPVINWPGVTVMNKRVINLSLRTVSGEISPEIGNLTHLQSLSIHGDIQGTIPNEISNLVNLQKLSLSSSPATYSPIPEDIGNITNLKTLYATHVFSGPLPASFKQLTKLTYLYLSNNNISGSLPDEISNFVHLEECILNNNDFNGTLPDSIGNLEQLVNFDIHNNNFSGNIPASIGNLKHITNLDISHNTLEGPLPETFGNMESLQFLKAQHNNITALPTSFGRLSTLHTLDISYNNIAQIPDSIEYIHSLLTVNLAHNNISSLPENFGSWPRLRNLNMSYNSISHFPLDICFLDSVQNIHFTHNIINKLPSQSAELGYISQFRLDSNNIASTIPVELFTNPQLYLTLRHNRLAFEHVPQHKPDTTFYNGLYHQKNTQLTQHEFKVHMGDTVHIDIRDYCSVSDSNNMYFWQEYPDKISQTTQYEEDSLPNPILSVIITEEVLSKHFYCKIFNNNVAHYSFEGEPLPCLFYVNTDSIFFSTYTEEEWLQKQYPESYITHSQTIKQSSISNGTITCTVPKNIRGEVFWEASYDSKKWITLSDTITQTDLWANVLSLSNTEIIIEPHTPAYYRCVIKENTCTPYISDTLHILPYGDVLFNDFISPSDTTHTSIVVDSIEVIIPPGFSYEDVRLTIVKLHNTPSFPNNVKSTGTAYDVTLSNSSIFDIPLIIKLKNIQPEDIDTTDLLSYTGAYFDEKNNQWEPYDNSVISRTDSSITFLTNHLTKLSWYQIQHGLYTDYYTKDRVSVYYTYGSQDIVQYSDYENNLKKTGLHSWNNTNTEPKDGGNPYMIQDIAEYVNQIMNTFELKGLSVPEHFRVYVKTDVDENAYGYVGFASYLSSKGYLTLNTVFVNGQSSLQNTLAHEYMHYTQDYYMTVLLDNMFWMEAHAPLASRLVWNEDNLPLSDVEITLAKSHEPRKGFNSILDILQKPWDNAGTAPVIEKFSVNSGDANLASTFLHYMRSYRTGEKLDIVQLLTDNTWSSAIEHATWRTYLNSEIQSQLNSDIGTEYANFVTFLLSGEKDTFSMLSKNSHLSPFSYLIKHSSKESTGSFAQRFQYDFSTQTQDSIIENIQYTVPYLSSKMVLLHNSSPDTAVIVTYEPSHDLQEHNVVYHGYYNHTTETVEYINITDSSSYSLFLDARTETSVAQHTHTSFLLFVNTRCPSSTDFSSNFNVNATLTATPVMNIQKLAYVNVRPESWTYPLYTSSFMKTIIPDEPRPQTFNYTIHSYNKEIRDDSSYVIHIDLSTIYTLDNGINMHSAKKIMHVSEQIAYNYVTGIIEISHTSVDSLIHEAYYNHTTQTEIEGYTGGITHKEMNISIQDFNTFEEYEWFSYYDNAYRFEATNADEDITHFEYAETDTEYYSTGEISNNNIVNYSKETLPANLTMYMVFYNQ